MELDIRKLIAAGLLTGALAVGGASLVGAQEPTDDSTTTTVEPSDDSTADESTDDSAGRGSRGEGCDHGEDDASATAA